MAVMFVLQGFSVTKDLRRVFLVPKTLTLLVPHAIVYLAVLVTNPLQIMMIAHPVQLIPTLMALLFAFHVQRELTLLQLDPLDVYPAHVVVLMILQQLVVMVLVFRVLQEVSLFQERVLHVPPIKYQEQEHVDVLIVPLVNKPTVVELRVRLAL